MCPPPRSLALEANGCFMVQVHADLTEYKVAVRSVVPERELPSDQDMASLICGAQARRRRFLEWPVASALRHEPKGD